MRLHNFKQISTDLQVTMSENRVSERWPTRLRLREDEEGFESEFRSLLGAGVTNIERYIEWQRI